MDMEIKNSSNLVVISGYGILVVAKLIAAV